MKFPLFLAFALLMAGGAYGSPAANNYFQSLVGSILPNEVRMGGLDHFRLPNFTTEFKDKVLGISVKGKAEYFDGILEGMSRVERWGECQGPSYNNGEIRVNCTLMFRVLHMNYTSKMKYGKIPKIELKAKGSISNTQIFLETAQPLNSGYPYMKVLNIQNLGECRSEFKGLGPLNKFLSVLEAGYNEQCRSQFYYAFNNFYTNIVRNAVTKLQLPR